jgi:transposase
VEAELRDRLLPTPAVQRLVWVPGIGQLVADTLALEIEDVPRLEIEDVPRFPTARHVHSFHSYCRLVPGADNSAGKTRHKRSKDGNRSLKLAFHHAAVRAAQYFPEIRAEYRRLARRKGKPIARALLAKELATIAYAMLTKGEPFNGIFRGHVLSRTKRPKWPRLASPPGLTETAESPRA